MKLRRKNLFISFVLCGIGMFIGMSLSAFKNDSSLSRAQALSRKNLLDFGRTVDSFYIVNATGTPEDIRSYYFKSLRPALKRAEWILSYLDEEAYSRVINGAPLPKLEKNVPNPLVIRPSGIQVIDEWMGSEDASSADLLELSKVLAQKTSVLLKILTEQSVSESMLFDAARRQCIRIFTMGITGFDTPGSLNGITDAFHSLESLRDIIGCYEEELNAMDEKHMRNVSDAISAGAELCKADFESFDRASFYKKSIQPLYSGLWNIQQVLGVESRSESRGMLLPLNEGSTHLFSSEFLNSNFYAELLGNDQTSQRIALGRLLFFDPILSENNQRACASCHQPGFGFAENRPKSLALDEQHSIQRNAPGLINSVYAQDYFYDLRTSRLHDQVEHVIFNSDEFNTDYEGILIKMQSIDDYVQKFKMAFPEFNGNSLNAVSVKIALATYVASLTDWNSPFDRYMRGESQLDKQALLGFNLFMGKAACATCHFPPTFSGLVPPLYQENETEVLGITETNDFERPKLDSDLGRYSSGKPGDKYEMYKNSMKTTTVRNVELTAPYMHHGAYKTLEEVIEFYNKGGGAGMGLDVSNQTLSSDPLNLSDEEKAALLTFMKSLTHNPYASDPLPVLPVSKNKELNNRVSGGLY